jgi:hypothetical protein
MYTVYTWFWPTLLVPTQGMMHTYSGAHAHAGLVGALPPGALSASKQATMEAVRKQIDYYFSVTNLRNDIFLRSKVRVGCACAGCL